MIVRPEKDRCYQRNFQARQIPKKRSKYARNMSPLRTHIGLLTERSVLGLPGSAKKDHLTLELIEAARFCMRAIIRLLMSDF